MNEQLLEEVTIRLLKELGELTPDTEINDAITTMNVATVRIKRLQAELDAKWIPIVKGMEPEGKVLLSYDQECFGHFSPETECAYFDEDEGIWRFWLSDREVYTRAGGHTHYQELPTREIE